MLAVAQKHVDSAVSKTCNIPKGYSWDDFKNVYRRAYEMGCKGITTYREDGKRKGILNRIEEETEAVVDDKSYVESKEWKRIDGELCYVDPVTGRKECE